MVGLELIPYEEYHAGNPFKAFECEACRAKFHFATNAAPTRPALPDGGGSPPQT
jgi:hypothetical protein